MIHLGTSGWYYQDWIELFYPNNLAKKDWLIYYATQFDTVEVNASFYRLPSENMINGWKKRTSHDFLFTFKGSQFITHKKKLHDIDDYLVKFFNRIKIIKEKIGVVLWQLPPQMKRNITQLEDFLNRIDPDVRHCIEFRHKSWFEKDVYTILDKYNVAFCIISAPNLPFTIQITSDFAYFRMHGINDWYKHDYSRKELNTLATEIKRLKEKDIFVYFNNDFQGFAPKNCRELKELLM